MKFFIELSYRLVTVIWHKICIKRVQDRDSLLAPVGNVRQEAMHISNIMNIQIHIDHRYSFLTSLWSSSWSSWPAERFVLSRLTNWEFRLLFFLLWSWPSCSSWPSSPPASSPMPIFAIKDVIPELEEKNINNKINNNTKSEWKSDKKKTKSVTEFVYQNSIFYIEISIQFQAKDIYQKELKRYKNIPKECMPKQFGFYQKNWVSPINDSELAGIRASISVIFIRLAFMNEYCQRKVLHYLQRQLRTTDPRNNPR